MKVRVYTYLDEILDLNRRKRTKNPGEDHVTVLYPVTDRVRALGTASDARDPGKSPGIATNTD